MLMKISGVDEFVSDKFLVNQRWGQVIMKMINIR